MNVGRFLWPYFRGYMGWALLSMITTLAFAGSTLMLVALLRPIFSEVLLADDETVAESLPLPLPGAATEEEEAGTFEKLGVSFDLDALLDGFLNQLRAFLDIGPENAIFLPLLFAAVFFLRSLAAFFNGYLFQIIGLGATTDLRNALYNVILRQSSRFYGRHPSGELVSRVSNDISVMQNAISMRLLDFFQQSITLMGLIWLLMSKHFQLAVICLVLTPLVIYPIVRFGKGMRRTSHRTQERMADLANLVSEAVRGHRVVKAFGMEGFELGRFRQASRRHYRIKLRAQLLANAAGPVVETLAAVGAAFFLIYAGQTIRAGELKPSDLVAFLATLMLLYDPIRKLNKVNLILQESLAAAQRVAHLMGLPNEIQDGPEGRRLDGITEGIRFEEVSFTYDLQSGGETVLKNINLFIPRGEVVALVGPSGAGKSTMVNLLPRFFDPEEGRITIDNTDIRQLKLESLRELIGIVTQDTILFNDSVRNNIAYGRSDLPLEAVEAAARAAYAHDFVAALPEGYDTVIGEGGFKLSGGQRQRLAIARALLKDPPILILDEATSHLDSESEALVQKALYNLMRGRTALVIAHRLSTITRADRILVLEEGRVVEEGSHAELLRRGGAYKRLHDLQILEDDQEDPPRTPSAAEPAGMVGGSS